jgi:hypothetical protein
MTEPSASALASALASPDAAVRLLRSPVPKASASARQPNGTAEVTYR